MRVGGDDRLTRAYTAAGRLGDNAIAVATEREHGAFLEYRYTPLRNTFSQTAQVIQWMDAAGPWIEHAADKAPRSRLFAHLMGIEDTNLGIAYLFVTPFVFLA